MLRVPLYLLPTSKQTFQRSQSFSGACILTRSVLHAATRLTAKCIVNSFVSRSNACAVANGHLISRAGWVFVSIFACFFCILRWMVCVPLFNSLLRVLFTICVALYSSTGGWLHGSKHVHISMWAVYIVAIRAYFSSFYRFRSVSVRTFNDINTAPMVNATQHTLQIIIYHFSAFCNLTHSPLFLYSIYVLCKDIYQVCTLIEWCERKYWCFVHSVTHLLLSSGM